MDRTDRKSLLISAKKHIGAVVKYLKMSDMDDDMLGLVDLAQELKEFIEDTINMEE